MSKKINKSISFLKELENSNKDLYSFVIRNIRIAISNLNGINSVFKEYTDHSESHSEKILKLAKELIGSIKLTDYEKSIFILSAYYHDIGMFVTPIQLSDYIKEIEKSGNYEALLEDVASYERLNLLNNDTKKYFLALDHFRKSHNKRSSDFIKENFQECNKKNYFEGIYLWKAVSDVCFAHDLNYKKLNDNIYNTSYSIGNGERINILYLALLLRLSDVCHFSRDRAFPYFFNSIDFISEKSKSIWEYYADVVDTYPDQNTDCIEISATCKNFYNHRAIIGNSKYIQEELYHCHELLSKSKSKYQFPWKIVNVINVVQEHESEYDYFDTKFRLNYNKIVHLLMGNKLYREPLFSIREAIQNSIDSILVFNSLTRNKDSYILLDYKSLDEDNYVLDIYDNGTGMDKDIINNYFLSVGSKSFWYTSRCYDDWKISRNNIKLIADHGIGVLSYFMIAKKIEVFTIYHNSREVNHVYIDNFDDGIIFIINFKVLLFFFLK